MGLAYATTAALGLWIILWAIGAKGFDAFMVTVLVLVAAVTVRMLTPYIPGNRRR
jgi:hypothetical protein